MLGQTPAAAAPTAAPILTATAPAVAPVVTAAAPAAAPAVATGIGPAVRPGNEIEYMANRLRQIAEVSDVNKKFVMEGIKKDFAAFGFPTWQKMRDFVFKGETVMPSTYYP